MVEMTYSSDFTFYESVNVDGFVKSPKTVIPDLIRYPEVVEFTGFRLPPEWRKWWFSTFYEAVNVECLMKKIITKTRRYEITKKQKET